MTMRTLRRRRPRSGEHVDVLLVCNSGGHLLQLHLLRSAWADASRAWVSANKTDVRSLLAGERIFFAHSPTARSLPNFARNTRLAWRLVRRLRPAVVVTTGAGVALPFCWLGRLHGARVAYIESFARVEKPSLTLRAVAPIANRVYVQWPELLPHVRGARFEGSVFGDE